MLAEVVWTRETVAAAMGCAIPIVFIVVAGWHRVEKVRAATALKRKMIDRGMSADEIERVLKADHAG